MCRLLAGVGRRTDLAEPVHRQPHALAIQARASREGALTRHADGNGIAWYRRGGPPLRHRSARPLWLDERLRALCAAQGSSLAIAHARAATSGQAAIENCHPFVDASVAFAHVGSIGGIDRMREQLQDRLAPEYRRRLEGDTDSELLFALLLQAGLRTLPGKAYARVVGTLESLQENGGMSRNVRLAALHADGRSLYALRYASDGDPPLLYRSGSTLPGTTLVATEPVDGRRRGWAVLPRGKLWRMGARSATPA